MGCITSKNNLKNREKDKSQTSSHSSSILKSSNKTQKITKKYGGIIQLQAIDQSAILMRRKRKCQQIKENIIIFP